MRSTAQGAIGEMVAGNGPRDSSVSDGSSLARAPTRAASSFADPDRAAIFPIRRVPRRCEEGRRSIELAERGGEVRALADAVRGERGRGATACGCAFGAVGRRRCAVGDRLGRDRVRGADETVGRRAAVASGVSPGGGPVGGDTRRCELREQHGRVGGDVSYAIPDRSDPGAFGSGRLVVVELGRS